MPDMSTDNNTIPGGTEIEEVEPYGVEYERFALQKLFSHLKTKYSIETVAEIPAIGAKAMPSLYSVGWALAGCEVTLINGERDVLKSWEYMGLGDKLKFIEVEKIEQTELPGNQFDLVWNLNFLPAHPRQDELLREMKRLSKRYMFFIHVNGYNVGFPFHRFAHRLHRIPWTHGDVRFNKPRQLKKIVRGKGYEIIELGVVDCPYWPDSLGFRDIRLHKLGNQAQKISWKSRYIEWVKSNSYPPWLWRVYLLEKLPIPVWMKYPYAHLFYVIIK